MNLLKWMNRHVPAVYIPFLLLLCLNIWMNPNFLTPRGLNNFLLQIAPMALVVMAQTLAMLVRELDISIGSVVSLSTVLLATTMGQAGWVSLPLVVLAAVAIGAATGAVIAYWRVPGIVVTLATSMLWGGLALMIMPQPGGVVTGAFRRLIVSYSTYLPHTAVLLLAVLLLWKYVKKTALGQAIYATGGNPYSAFASGISTHRAKIAAFAGSALLASLAGLILAAKAGSGEATIGGTYTLASIAGAVLGGASFMGGIGSMRGAVGGAMVLSILVNILFFLGVSSFYEYIVQGAILLIAVIIGSGKIGWRKAGRSKGGRSV